MFVKQISVFLENRSGSLAGFTRQLGDHGIDLMSLSIADTTDFGILRCIAADYERAEALLSQAGYSVKITDVIAVSIPDRPGSLAEVLTVLSSHNIGLEYLYSFFRNHGDHALIIIRVDQPAEAVKVLASAGVTMLTQGDLQTL